MLWIKQLTKRQWMWANITLLQDTIKQLMYKHSAKVVETSLSFFVTQGHVDMDKVFTTRTNKWLVEVQWLDNKQTSSTLYCFMCQWWARGQLTKMHTLGTGICQILSTNSQSPQAQMQHWYSKNMLFRTSPQLSKTCLPSSGAPASTLVNHLALVYPRNDLWKPLIYPANWNQSWARTAQPHHQVRT